MTQRTSLQSGGSGSSGEVSSPACRDLQAACCLSSRDDPGRQRCLLLKTSTGCARLLGYSSVKGCHLIEGASLSWPDYDFDLNGRDYTRDRLSRQKAKRKGTSN